MTDMILWFHLPCSVRIAVWCHKSQFPVNCSGSQLFSLFGKLERHEALVAYRNQGFILAKELLLNA